MEPPAEKPPPETVQPAGHMASAEPCAGAGGMMTASKTDIEKIVVVKSIISQTTVPSALTSRMAKLSGHASEINSCFKSISSSNAAISSAFAKRWTPIVGQAGGVC